VTSARFWVILALENSMIRPLRTVVLLAFLAPCALAGDIAWTSGFEKTLERASAEKKVVFLAVNMDGERANDRMVEKVYRDKAVVELSARTLNLVASAAEHAKMDKDCPRFPGVRCQDHRRVDSAARKDVLKSDAQGLVLAPQHVFLGSDGQVILSVPYEIAADELVWCFVTALTKADPATAPAMPTSARSPQRLVLGGTSDPTGADAGGSLVPPTKKEVDAIIKRLERGLEFAERVNELRRLIQSDEPDAIEFIGKELKSGGFGGGMGGLGGGGGGLGGRGGGGGGPRQQILLHAIGVYSPPAYWAVVTEFLGHSDEILRREAAVTLEQLGAREAVPALTKALAQEKEPGHQKDLIRALGACGAADAKVRAMLIQRAKKDKQTLVRQNAVLAMAWSTNDADVKAFLRAALESGEDWEREAAALAVGIGRDAAWIPVLDVAAPRALDPNAKAAIEASRKVLEGEPLSTLRDHVTRVGRDEISRDRIFGRAPGGGGR